MRWDWKRLLIQILSALAGGISAVNLGRLTVPDVGAGPGELAGWVGLPAVASLAGLIAQRFVGGSTTADKPGCAGHKKACDSLYELAMDGQWERARRVIDAWQDPRITRVIDAWQGKVPPEVQP